MSKPNVVIIYAGYCQNGSTGQLAKSIASGATKRGANVKIYWLNKGKGGPSVDVINNANAIILGSGVYDGNIEPDMATYIDTTLQAGNKNKPVDMSSKIGAAFCTSAGYASGAQPVLNSLIRYLMTFGATILGSGDWHGSQGICGMVVDNKAVKGCVPNSWKWADGQKYLLEDAASLGSRIANVASFYTTEYNKAAGLKPSPGKIENCSSSAEPHGWMIATIVLGVILFAAMVVLVSKLKREQPVF